MSPPLEQQLLDWYDKNHRVLPWRANPGQKPNPYHVYLSEIMLQQTTVPTVVDYFHRFTEKWPTINDLSKASLDDILILWQGLGYYSRARNLYKCVQQIIESHNSIIPKDPNTLIKLSGIGDYTANSIASIAYDAPCIPVDGNVARVFSRLFIMETPLPDLLKTVRKFALNYIPSKRSGDFAQSLMDLGSMICKPKNPLCTECPLSKNCRAYKEKRAEELPKRKPKSIKPTLHANVYLIENAQGELLIEKRPDKGLLANLKVFPTSSWADSIDKSETCDFLSQIHAESLNKRIKHTFTHFHLYLTIHRGSIQENTHLSDNQEWVAPKDLAKHALPTLMKKVIAEI